MKYRALVTFLALTAMSAVSAAERGIRPVGQTGQVQNWQLYDDGMTPSQYRDAYRHNQDLALDYVKSYSKNTLRSVGIPKAGINLMGTAAGLAVGRDARFYLNKSRLLALEVKDVTGAERSLIFGVKLDW